jgi:hypothetical protein
MTEQVAQSSPMDILNSMDSAPAGDASQSTSTPTTPTDTFDRAKYGQTKIKYMASGKEVEESLDTIINTRAPYGYHAAQRLEEANKKFQEAEQRFKTSQEMEQRWKQFDDYAKQNPAWMEHVNKSWQERENLNVDPSDPLAQRFSTYDNKIGTVESKVDQLLGHFQKQEQAKQDQEYMGQVESVKKAYPDIDFAAADEQGRSLEYRILEHASKKNITSAGFETAFRDYYHDKLITLERAKAKEEAVKELQDQRKKGILGKSQAPQKTFSPADVSRMTSDDIRNAALNDASIWGS